jgi:surfeit locus 1 family protein
VIRARAVLVALALAGVAALLSLGVWQLQRRTWKLALIAQVERRLAAAPVAAPPGPVGKADEYTKVAAYGRWRRGDTYTQAVTAVGPGFWVLTPFDTARGTLLVNRGFVPAAMRGRAPAPSGDAVRGLLRLSEPEGGFLRTNDPAADRWYSRDVAAIARRRGISPVAPYFIDVEASGSGWPRGGMTVVRFRNTHLVYALTWFALAAMLGWFTWRLARIPREE